MMSLLTQDSRGSLPQGRARQALVWLRRAGILGLAIVTVLAIAELFPRLLPFFASGRARLGWDLKVVCTAFSGMMNGADPYLVQQRFPLPYSVLHLYAFSPLCQVAEPVFYGIVFVATVAATALLVLRLTPDRAIDRVLVFVMMFIGLHAFRWLLDSGNVAIFEMPLAALTLLLVARKRFAGAGAAFGLLGTLKFLPISGAVAFLLLPTSLRNRLLAFAAALGAFVAFHGLNALLFWNWLPSWWSLLSDRVPGGGTYEIGSIYNPNLIDFVDELLQRAHITHPMSEFAFAGLGLAIGWLATIACLRRSSQEPMQPVAILSIAILVIWLFLFRQKPYAFGTFVPFLIVAAYSAGRRTAIAVALVTIIVPAILRKWTAVPPLLHDYYQLIGLWAAIMTVLAGRLWELAPPAPADTPARVADA